MASQPTPAPTTSFNRPTPPPLASRPSAPSNEIISASTPTPEITKPSKPTEEDRIGRVGTAYTPVSLPKPGKLGNRWGAGSTPREEESNETPQSGGVKSLGSRWGGSVGSQGGGVKPGIAIMDIPTGGGGKKLTWSERQAEAKKQREEEDLASQNGECDWLYNTMSV